MGGIRAISYLSAECIPSSVSNLPIVQLCESISRRYAVMRRSSSPKSTHTVYFTYGLVQTSPSNLFFSWPIKVRLRFEPRPMYSSNNRISDVVPVEPSTISQWTHPPYSGHFDGKNIFDSTEFTNLPTTGESVWGRGSVDDKNGLIGILFVPAPLIIPSS